MLRPIPHTCMLAITAMPAILMALTVILMVATTATPATTDTDTGTVDTTVDTTAIPMPDTADMLTTTASVLLKLNPQCLTPTVAPKVPVDSTDSPMPVMPPLPTTAFPTTDKLRAIVSPGEDFR